MGKVTVFGSANIDIIAKVPHLPSRGETVTASEYMTAFGGKGANEAVAAARLGAQVSLVAMLGDDSYGKSYQAHLQSEGVDCTCIGVANGLPSGSALIAVEDGSGENHIIVCSGANTALGPESVAAAEHQLLSSDIVLLQFEIPHPTILEVLARANSAQVPVIVNASPVSGPLNLPGHKVDYLLVNEVEAQILSGKDAGLEVELKSAALALHEQGAVNVIITRGADPVFVSSPIEQFLVPTYPVSPVDTVGAGDTFAGALATALSEKQSLHDSARFATIAAALATLQSGAQGSMPRREQVNAITSADAMQRADSKLA